MNSPQPQAFDRLPIGGELALTFGLVAVAVVVISVVLPTLLRLAAS